MRRHVEEYMKKCRACQRLIQSSRAKLSAEKRETDRAPQLGNLNSKFRMAYKRERDNGRKLPAADKRNSGRSTKEREFVNSDNPATQAAVPAKFRRPWVGPWRETEKRSRQNYTIADRREKQLIVHVNRLIRVNDPVEWEATEKQNEERKVRPKRRQPNEEGDQEIPSSGPIPSREPRVENLRPAERQSPDRDCQILDTPQSNEELGVTQESPPLTELRSRMHEIQEASNEERCD
jgi:hypothetical protein